MSDDFCRDRRRLLLALGGLGVAGSLYPLVSWPKSLPRIYKKIPSSGEKIPVIGMGSSRTFDVSGSAEKAPLQKVLNAFFDAGGGMIDSSPMYGEAEKVIGELLQKIPAGKKKSLFAATKVWTDGKQAGIEQMKTSMQLMGVDKFDLLQIHNLRDWEYHLETLQQWKAEKKVRYIGITTSHGRFHAQLEQLLSKHPFDFVQLSYNIVNREVEKRLLPIAQEKGIAVIVNRPYAKGSLFRSVKGKSLPAWAADIDCQSWGQYFLKYAVSHPAVTCAIPATSKLKHMVDNMAAGLGKLPEQKLREKMRKHFLAQA